MNRYIVVTEKGQVTVDADGAEITDDGTLIFYMRTDVNVYGHRILRSAFKEYKYFLLDEEDDTLNDLKVDVESAIIRTTHPTE